MLTDSREVQKDAALEYDICIVGAGPAGITLALELQNTPYKVALLESAGQNPDEQTSDLLRGEVNTQHLSVDSFPYPLYTARERAFGGSSLRWCLEGGWRGRPLDAIDLEARSCIPESGWPFDRNSLDDYYERAYDVCGFQRPFSENVAKWQPSGPEYSELWESGNLRSDLFRRGNVDKFRNMFEVIKQSPNIHLYLHANAINIATDDSPQIVNALDVATLRGNHFQIKARVYVLAMGGIDNPRLLLESSGTYKHGLGNEHDLVGRYFMEHPHIDAGYVHLSDRSMADRMQFYSLFQMNGSFLEGCISLSEDLIRQEQLPNVGFWLIPTSIRSMFQKAARTITSTFETSTSMPSRSLRQRSQNLIQDIADIADIPVQRLVKRANKLRIFRLHAESEQVPNPNSRVTLSDEFDALGCHKPKLNWQITDYDIQTIRRSEELLDRELRKQNLGYITHMLGDETPPSRMGIGNHLIGTTRMHTNPKHGVVDANSQVHGLSNLFITGSSVFPTGGAANPTLTIVALAVRLADHLKTHLE